ncbi:MAG: anthranilate synthase component I family protein [Planctomycetota bacterium]
MHSYPSAWSARTNTARGSNAVYQANLAHRMTIAVEGDPLALYLALRRTNAAPYAGYLEHADPVGGRHALLSSSPELMVELTDGRARTRPIKGTSERHDDPDLDARSRAELLASRKDRAELAMIVDLARNDLGRLAVRGGVDVGPFPELESYAAVHHLVADVCAELRPEVDAVDCLAATFPAASISGAPKLAAMEWIAALEGEGRSFFTGSLGFIDTVGRACFNVLIRTLEWREERGSRPEVWLTVGGGITWDSVAAAEDRETLHKARAMLRALGVEEPA